jgi:hypothetical protein
MWGFSQPCIIKILAPGQIIVHGHVILGAAGKQGHHVLLLLIQAPGTS